MADTFLAELQSMAKLHNWPLDVRPASLIDTSSLSLAKTREALPILFESAKQFMISVTDEATVNLLVEDVRSHFDEATRKNVSYFETAK